MGLLLRDLRSLFLCACIGALAPGCASVPEEIVEVNEDSSAAPGATPYAQNPWSHPEIKAELLLDRQVARDPSDGGGTARLLDLPPEGPRPIPASSRQSFVIEYEAGPLGIAPGGTIFFQVSPFWGWELPQTGTDQRGGFLRATTSVAGVNLSTTPLTQGLVAIEVNGPGLRAGETVRIEFGAGASGTRVDRFAETGERLWLAVDGNGDGIRKLIEESPSVDIMAREASRLHLALPGSAAAGAIVPLTIALLDRAGNSGMPWVGQIDLAVEGAEAGITMPAAVSLAPEDQGRKTIDLRVPAPGVYRISAVARPSGTEEAGPAAQSNPLVVQESPTQTLLWGDLQVHTQLSDGSGSTLENLVYARDAAGIDVVALTDHDHWGLKALDDFPEVWQEQLGEVQAFNEPGRFVTVPAFEWTNWVEGHRHVLFFGSESPELLSSLDERYDTPPELWAALAGKNAMTIAQHSAGGPVPTDWSIPPDPDLEPLTEIVSVHGSSESPDSPMPIYKAKPGNYVRDALDRGYRLGFLGSSDGHDGHPGLAGIASGGKSGLAGIWVDGKEPRTRRAIARALRARSVYATSGPRIYLRVDLDGLPMGSVLDAPIGGEADRTQVLSWEIAAETSLERVDIIRRGARVMSIRLDGERDLAGSIEVPVLGPGDWLYLRAVQRDGGAAWSSPFFVLRLQEVDARTEVGSSPQP
ncbi:MAG TPA: hypothetical protein DCG06_03635 [Deltaproteobacteria bacterium]|nr:hypothetical protein [Deltaproteobacteria bacterium]